MDVVIELIKIAAGSLFGVLAIAYLTVTIRSVVFGRSAYDANKAATYPSIKRNMMGDLPDDSGSFEPRTSHGLAIEIRSKKLRSQRRLSAEAIDDVIGRRF